MYKPSPKLLKKKIELSNIKNLPLTLLQNNIQLRKKKIRNNNKVSFSPSMATTRLLCTSRNTSSSSSSFSVNSHYNSSPLKVLCMRFNKEVGPPFDEEKRTAKAGGNSSVNGERKSTAVKAVVNAGMMTIVDTSTKSTMDIGVDISLLTTRIQTLMEVATRKRPWTFIIQMFIEKVIIDCRFFTMFAVAGSLLGSVLCFVEGCVMIMQSYLRYFHALSLGLDRGQVIHLLIEAIDMFLVGTAMLIFGVSIHVMFVGSKNLNAKGSNLNLLPQSNFFGLFYLKKVPSWVGIGSITDAKSRIGHALMMILQVGVLDKFKSIPMSSGLDLACFAGAVFVSSACIFLLSKLSFTSSSTADR